MGWYPWLPSCSSASLLEQKLHGLLEQKSRKSLQILPLLALAEISRLFPDAAITLPILVSTALENFPQITEIYSRRKKCGPLTRPPPTPIIEVTSLVYGQKTTPTFSAFVLSCCCGVDDPACPLPAPGIGSPPPSPFCLLSRGLWSSSGSCFAIFGASFQALEGLLTNDPFFFRVKNGPAAALWALNKELARCTSASPSRTRCWRHCEARDCPPRTRTAIEDGACGIWKYFSRFRSSCPPSTLPAHNPPSEKSAEALTCRPSTASRARLFGKWLGWRQRFSLLCGAVQHFVNIIYHSLL